MRKKYKHTERSKSYKCKKCGRGIKERLVEIKKEVPKLCYKHYMESK